MNRNEKIENIKESIHYVLQAVSLDSSDAECEQILTLSKLFDRAMDSLKTRSKKTKKSCATIHNITK